LAQGSFIFAFFIKTQIGKLAEISGTGFDWPSSKARIANRAVTSFGLLGAVSAGIGWLVKLKLPGDLRLNKIKPNPSNLSYPAGGSPTKIIPVADKISLAQIRLQAKI